MRRRVLQFIGIVTFRYAWMTFLLVLLLTGASLRAIWLMRFDTSLVAFLPPPSPEERKIREAIGDYRNLEPILVVLRARESGHDEELIEMAREMARLLDHPRYFLPPVYRVADPIQNFYESISDVRLIQLLTDEDWEMLRHALGSSISSERLRRLRANRNSIFAPPQLKQIPPQDPLGTLDALRTRLAYSRGPTRLDTEGGYFLSSDGKAITVLLYPVLSPTRGRDTTRTLSFLQHTRKYFKKRYPDWAGLVEINFNGSFVESARDIQRVQEELDLILKFSVCLVFLLILLVFRKFEALVFIILPPAVGLTWTLGLAYLLYGGISAISAAFLIIITAIGMHYSIHLYHRFTLELYRQYNYYRALRRSYVETARGILASAVVVAALFALLFLTSIHETRSWSQVAQVLRDYTGFGHLSAVAGLGILCNLGACLLSIPLLAAVKYRLARGRIKPVDLYSFRIERLYEPAIYRPRATFCAMLLFCVFFGYHAHELNFYPRFASVSPFFFRDAPSAAEDTDDTQASFPPAGRPILAVVHDKDLQGALEQNDRLYENLQSLRGQFDIFTFESLRTALPSIRSQRRSIEQLEKLDLKPFHEAVRRVSREVGIKPEVYEPYLSALQAFKEKARHPDWMRLTVDEPDLLVGNILRFITSREDGFYVATVIYPHAGGFNPDQIEALAARLENGIDGLTLIGDPIVERKLAGMIKFNMAVMFLFSTLLILAALLLHFRSWRLAWITLLPVIAEMVWLCGAMALAGLKIHFFVVLVLPLIFCLAMDNALQLVQYYNDRQPCSVRHAMKTVGRVGVLTGGVIAALLGTLSLTSYPAMRDSGLVLLIGLGMILIGTNMLLPSLLELFGRGQPLREVFLVESEIAE